MNKPAWLNRERIEFIHQQSIELAGGSHGLRDAGLLESALARARNLYAYGETDIFQLAASYAEAISQNHPFVDGNKRVVFTAADTFLDKNGYELMPCKGDEHADMIENLAQSHISREDSAQHFRNNCRAIAQE
jgi:death-on-curing protein